MNTPLGSHPDELRHAEYALGVLDAPARVAVEQEMRDDPHAARAVALWQQHLAPLADDLADVAPAPYVWARIQSDLGLNTLQPNIFDSAAAASPTGRISWWDSLQLWRWVGIGASAVAAAAIMVVLVQPQTTAPAAANSSYMVASIMQDNGVAGWTATMDMQHHRLLVVPATPVAMANNREAQLWLIPPGGKPISLGMLPKHQPISMALSSSLQAQVSANALLAVSVEPPGGSPTGQPTGPVIAKGAISGV